jgi:hypothetical protein
MTYIVEKSHNGKYGHVTAGTIHPDSDSKYISQLLRMGLIRIATQADIDRTKPREVYRTKPAEPKVTKPAKPKRTK